MSRSTHTRRRRGATGRRPARFGLLTVLLLVVVATLAASGCGGGGGDSAVAEPATQDQPAESSSAAETTAEEGDAALSTERYTPVAPEPGTDIPAATVTFGMRPYADNTFYVIGIEEGWFDDVGITIEPKPYGLKTTEDQWVNLLLNRQVDINTATCGNMLASYKTTDQLKCVGFADTFYGLVMLANPRLGLKTVRDYVEAGSTFEEALQQALAPLSGKKVYVPTAAAARGFHSVPFELAGVDLPTYEPLDDSQMLLLAKSGRLDFMNPAGAPIAQELLDLGWTPVYDTGQLLEYGPGGVDSPLESLVFNNGWAATADYVNENQATMLRFASVVYRIISALQNDPALYDVYTPYLNSVAGTSLTGEGVRRTVETLDPLVTFEAQAKYFDDPAHAEYYANSMGALIASLEADGTVPSGITPDDIIWAAPMYQELVDYRTKTDELFATAETMELSSDKRELLDRARRYYEWYDFLDAYRLATAAVG